MARRMGENSYKQKGGADGVLHIVDLEKIPSPKDINFINEKLPYV